jgi:hypothetical protein
VCPQTRRCLPSPACLQHDDEEKPEYKEEEKPEYKEKVRVVG